MLFTFFIAIVFIAELIIALTMISYLYKFDCRIKEFDDFLTEAKPSITEISILTRNISNQVFELTKKYIKQFEQSRDELIIRQFAKFILGLLFLNKVRKSKLGRRIVKGLSLLQIVV